MICFAYGSNMDTARLRARVTECITLGVAVLPGRVLRFHKRSKIDGSAKCNALPTGNNEDRVIGVLFDIPDERKPALDRAEGLGNGYHEEAVSVRTAGGQEVDAIAYIADDDVIDDSLSPTAAYRDHVEKGAIEHGLPEDYIARHITSVETE